jgi:HD-GYP domain-containing protein (c-di-GMP phosphodiesterase class II)
MAKVTIKQTILFVFIALISIISVSIIYSNYYFSKKLALSSTFSQFKILSEDISFHIKRENEDLKNMLSLLSLDERIGVEIVNNDINHPILKEFVRLLSIRYGLYSVYIYQKNGNFFELININNNKVISDTFKPPKASMWMVVNLVGDKETYFFLDKNLKIIKRKVKKRVYNPKQHQWYKNAIHSNNVELTKPYKFNYIHKNGITYSKTTPDGNVIAVDYTIDVINKYLKSLESMKSVDIFIINDKFEYMFASNDNLVGKKIDSEIIADIKSNKFNRVLNYKSENILYYALVTRFGTIGGKYIGVRIDSDKLLMPYIQNLYYSLSIALLLLLLFIPVVIYSTRLILNPIKKLIDENKKVKDMNFCDVQKVNTYIVEFEELSDSLLAMSSSIQEYQKNTKELLDSIVKLIAKAIDAKSEYTAGHCARVPEISMMIMDALNKDDEIFKDFSFEDKDKIKEFEIGAWLHDCGKVTTPEYVVDKATKLETIYNRIHEIRTRFEVLLRDAKIDMLEKTISKEEYETILKELHQDFKFIAEVNIGGEFLDEQKISRIKNIAQRTYIRHFSKKIGLGTNELLRCNSKEEKLPVVENLLDDKKEHLIKREYFDMQDYKKHGFKMEVPEYLYNRGELYNLCIEKGTLTPEERYKINEHVIMSIKMLEEIPFPDIYKKIPEYAGTHHETLNGTGYPRKLTKDKLSIGSRVMAIADIFEALSASDRPYKKAKTLSETLKIMSFMAKDNDIDPDIFRVFVKNRVYMQYAKKYLNQKQIDDVNIEELNL